MSAVGGVGAVALVEELQDALPTALLHPRLTFSFAAAGWLQTYHFGVAKALQDVGLVVEDVRFCGSSAGSLAAAALVTKCDMDQLREYAVACSIDCRSSLTNAFKIRKYVRKGIEVFAVDRFRSDISLRRALSQQLEVYVSVLPWCRKKVLHCFHAVEDLEEALVASCCLTPLAGMPFPLRRTGEIVCDGGMTAFQPRKGEHNVITVSALYFNSADIRPTTFVPAWWGLYPPREKDYRELYDHGYNDAVSFLVRTRRIDAGHLKRLKPLPPQPELTALSLVIDLVAGIVFMLFLRPCALFLIYAEMFLSTAFLFLKALVWFTRHPASWRDVYHGLRNVVSARVLLHVLLGSHVPVDHQRLEESSRLYRVLQPILYR
jgi:hypothetical protein